MKNILYGTALGTLFMLAMATPSAGADKAPDERQNTFTEALTWGRPFLDARYRYEFVDQDGLPEEANAHTVRTRLGYETGRYYGFSALLEFENVAGPGGESYNDTINGKTAYPIVADPEDTNVNRLQISYTGLPDTGITLGRQVISLDNQRFVGPVGWRQNDQTFDAISIGNQSLPDTELFYAYANQVNRVFGTDSPIGTWDDSHIHLIHAAYAGFDFGKLAGYGYLLDIPDATTMSSATFGARFEGKQGLREGLTGLLNLEYAHQSDYADNPTGFDFSYYSVEPGITIGQWTIKGQYSSIEGDGSTAFQFPLGTNHAFNGWADKFLVTPADGLVDANIGLSYVARLENPYLNGIKTALVYHDFSAENGSAGYGTEWDASIEQSFEEHYTLGIKLAHYDADDLFTDTTKIMPYFQVKF